MSAITYSTDTPFGKVVITKLHGSNYERWSHQVRSALIAIDAWELIEGDSEVPGEESSVNERRLYRILNNRGFSLIYNSVDEARQILLDRTHDSCRSAWYLLKCLYSKERALERRDLEEVIEEWRDGRRKSKEVMKELVRKLKDLDGEVKLLVDGGTVMRIAGSAMQITGTVLEVFFPPARGIGSALNAWGRGVDLCGVAGVSLVKLYELGFSKAFLNRVATTLKADREKTDKMITKLIEMDSETLNDLVFGLSTFFRRRYGKEIDISKLTGKEIERVPLWKDLTHALGVPFVEWKGDSALRAMGVEEVLRPVFVHGALLAWNVYYLMTTRGLQSEAQYVTYAESVLKRLEEELEDSLPRAKKD